MHKFSNFYSTSNLPVYSLLNISVSFEFQILWSFFHFTNYCLFSITNLSLFHVKSAHIFSMTNFCLFSVSNLRKSYRKFFCQAWAQSCPNISVGISVFLSKHRHYLVLPKSCKQPLKPCIKIIMSFFGYRHCYLSAWALGEIGVPMHVHRQCCLNISKDKCISIEA